MSFWPKPPHFSTDAMGLSQVPAVSTHLASPTASTDASPRSYSSVGSFRNSLHGSFNSSRGGAGLAGHDFELLECIGCGAFGKVFRARERTSKETVAIKLIDMETADDDIEDIQKEVEVMAHCNSKHLVQYLHSYVYDTKLCVVMEHLAGSVRAFLSCGGLPEECTQAILHEVLQGLAYLHDEGKMHRDIKAANILYSPRGEIKLADFGVARQITQTLAKSFVGTPFWMAPEVISQLEYDYKADIWSLGILALELCNGDPPYADEIPGRALLLISNSAPPRLEGGDWSAGARDFAAQCLQKEASTRPSARSLCAHRWLDGTNPRRTVLELIEKRASTLAAAAAAPTVSLANGRSLQRKSLPPPVVNSPAGSGFVWDFEEAADPQTAAAKPRTQQAQPGASVHDESVIDLFNAIDLAVAKEVTRRSLFDEIDAVVAAQEAHAHRMSEEKHSITEESEADSVPEARHSDLTANCIDPKVICIDPKATQYVEANDHNTTKTHSLPEANSVLNGSLVAEKTYVLPKDPLLSRAADVATGKAAASPPLMPRAAAEPARARAATPSKRAHTPARAPCSPLAAPSAFQPAQRPHPAKSAARQSSRPLSTPSPPPSSNLLPTPQSAQRQQSSGGKTSNSESTSAETLHIRAGCSAHSAAAAESAADAPHDSAARCDSPASSQQPQPCVGPPPHKVLLATPPPAESFAAPLPPRKLPFWWSCIASILPENLRQAHESIVTSSAKTALPSPKSASAIQCPRG